VSWGKVVSDPMLLAATRHLVEIRASQINGCAFCVDMYAGDHQPGQWGQRHPEW
jgi:alkylhydroperoxidase family enzyme